MDNTFDIAFTTLMYHYLTEVWKSRGFVELARVLKPNGRLLVVDMNPARRNILTSLPGHNRLERQDYVRSDVTVRMEEAGLVVVESGAHCTRRLTSAIGRKEQS